MIEYRKAIKSDTKKLSALRVAMICDGKDYDRVFREKLYTNTQEYLSKGFDDNTVSSWVATKNNEIIAMCCMSYFALPPNEVSLSGKSAHLGNMYTLPMFRNKGIASKLLELIVSEAKSRQCDRIILVPTENGKSLYEKFGFLPWFGAMAFFPTK